jgi:hypothetical protein
MPSTDETFAEITSHFASATAAEPANLTDGDYAVIEPALRQDVIWALTNSPHLTSMQLTTLVAVRNGVSTDDATRAVNRLLKLGEVVIDDTDLRVTLPS